MAECFCHKKWLAIFKKFDVGTYGKRTFSIVCFDRNSYFQFNLITCRLEESGELVYANSSQ